MKTVSLSKTNGNYIYVYTTYFNIRKLYVSSTLCIVLYCIVHIYVYVTYYEFTVNSDYFTEQY
jgi:hypothetical protein